MNNVDKVYCPASQDFLYWAPESISDYDHWCEIEPKELVQAKQRIEQDEKSPQADFNG